VLDARTAGRAEPAGGDAAVAAMTRATVLSITEGQPASWPAIPGFTGTVADAAATWQRLEAWISHRWPARPVVMIVEGPGTFLPPLAPLSIATVEGWAGGGTWASASLAEMAAPLGYALDADTSFRFTGTVGDDTDPPAVVLEAARRLAEFFASIAAEPSTMAGYTSETLGDYSHTGRPSAWAARAMVLSGAADLLRPWRALR